MHEKETCIYCGRDHGLTQDHVPPKCFFENPCPNNAQLITVPCCNKCRREDEKYDAFVRNVIASTFESESTPYVKRHITEKVSRSIERKRWETKRLFEIAKKEKIHLPFQEKPIEVVVPILRVDIPEMDRFFERIARAVLHDTYKITFFAGRVRWLPIESLPQDFIQQLSQRPLNREILEVFEYRVSPQFCDGTYIVDATFYKVRRFILQIETIKA